MGPSYAEHVVCALMRCIRMGKLKVYDGTARVNDFELTVTVFVIDGFTGAVHAVAHHVVHAERVHLVRFAPVPLLVLVPLVVLAEFVLLF